MRLQAATEYLTTYGWALALLGAIIVVFFAAGFFNPKNYAASQCIFTSSFACLGFLMASNGLLTVNLQSALSQPINVTAIGCNQNATIRNMVKPFNPPTNQIFLPVAGNYTFTTMCYLAGNGLIIGNSISVFTGGIIINYTNKITNLPGTAFGKLTVKVTGA